MFILPLLYWFFVPRYSAAYHIWLIREDDGKTIHSPNPVCVCWVCTWTQENDDSGHMTANGDSHRVRAPTHGRRYKIRTRINCIRYTCMLKRSQSPKWKLIYRFNIYKYVYLWCVLYPAFWYVLKYIKWIYSEHMILMQGGTLLFRISFTFLLCSQAHIKFFFFFFCCCLAHTHTIMGLGIIVAVCFCLSPPFIATSPSSSFEANCAIISFLLINVCERVCVWLCTSQAM